jgi:hypothetical protein
MFPRPSSKSLDLPRQRHQPAQRKEPEMADTKTLMIFVSSNLCLQSPSSRVSGWRTYGVAPFEEATFYMVDVLVDFFDDTKDLAYARSGPT